MEESRLQRIKKINLPDCLTGSSVSVELPEKSEPICDEFFISSRPEPECKYMPMDYTAQRNIESCNFKTREIPQCREKPAEMQPIVSQRPEPERRCVHIDHTIHPFAEHSAHHNGRQSVMLKFDK